MNKILLVLIIIIIFLGAFILFQTTRTQGEQGKVIIQEETFKVKIVRKPEDLKKGLSGIDSMPDNQGMLFVFENKGDYAFWMKDMNFPLDILFLDDNKIVTIHEQVPSPLYQNENLPVYRSTQPANKVLELNAGTASKYKIKVGDIVTIQ